MYILTMLTKYVFILFRSQKQTEEIMNIEEAKNLKPGQIIYHTQLKDCQGAKKKFTVTSVKKWKTRPNEVEVRTKFGLYTFLKFTDLELNQITTEV